MTDGPSFITEIKQADLTQAERDTLRADHERWEHMGKGGHLDDWLAYYPGLSIRRRLAMKLAHTNRPKGRGYVQNYSQLMRDDGFDTDDKTAMSQFGAVLWIRDTPEHEKILRAEVLAEMSPGQRSRLNTPLAAKQRVVTKLKEQERGEATEQETSKTPMRILKDQVEEQNRKIAHLEEQLATAEAGSLFDLKRDSVDHIVHVMTDPTSVSADKARKIAAGILSALESKRSEPGPKAQAKRAKASAPKQPVTWREAEDGGEAMARIGNTMCRVHAVNGMFAAEKMKGRRWEVLGEFTTQDEAKATCEARFG